MVRQNKHSSTKCFVGKDIPVQSIPVGKDIPVQSIPVGKDIPVQSLPVSKEIPVQNSLSLTVVKWTVCVIYIAGFEYQVKSSSIRLFLTVDLVVTLTLAFGIQTKRSFWNTKKQPIFQHDRFEGGSRCQTKI